jgi:hypothetical protein
MTRDIHRYSEAGEDVSPEQAYMRTLIRTERKDGPSDAVMQEIATRLGPILTSSRTSARASVTRQRLSLVTVVAVALSAGIYGLRPRTDCNGPSPVVVVPASETAHGNEVSPSSDDMRPSIVVGPEKPSSSSRTFVPTLSVESLPKAPPSARMAPAVARPACTNEVELLERADAALRSDDAARALAITRDHVARCATGSFVQERERIAIEALARLGLAPEMRQRALAFEERYPASPHLRLIRKLLEEHPERAQDTRQ